jgi:hypothetical protein
MKKIIFCSFLIMLIVGCYDIPIWIAQKVSVVYEFQNSSGNNPTISDPINLSPSLSIGSQTAIYNGNIVQILLHDVRVQTVLNNFEIKDGGIKIREKEGNKWKEQSEFDLAASSRKTDAVAVIVIDMSESIGDKIEEVKSYAKTLAADILNSTTNSHVGVVLFSENVQSMQFAGLSELDAIEEFIDSYTTYSNRTTLYGAVNAGLTMLENTGLLGAKSLIAFTDGGDNNTDHPETALSNITTSELTRFAIGVKGNDFDQRVLENIASKNANCAVASNYDDLQKVFKEIAQQVTSVYQISYVRSNQILDNPIQIEFEFSVDKI